ncbi:MAG: tetraacyldisaccharide 4'-kinase [Pseudomonadota bacterium]
MRAPRFWSNPPEAPGTLAHALWPASRVWQIATKARLRRTGWRAPIPVLSIGNLSVGGTGKTPLVRALAERLAAQGAHPHVVSRGYGGSRPGPHRVDLVRDTPAEVGDEPLMLAATLPVWVARRRAEGGRAAAAAGASVIVLDDGHQNPDLQKDVAILTVDAGAGFGNGRVMPAGPLREPVATGLARAEAVVLIGTPEERAACRAAWPVLGACPLVEAALCPALTGLDLAGQPVVAFAGIGRPEKFFATVAAMGARLLAAEPFPDHHVYSPAVLRRLLRAAREAGALLLTTEKDAVRLPPEIRREVMVLPVALVIEDWSAIDAALAPFGLGIAAKRP